MTGPAHVAAGNVAVPADDDDLRRRLPKPAHRFMILTLDGREALSVDLAEKTLTVDPSMRPDEAAVAVLEAVRSVLSTPAGVEAPIFAEVRHRRLVETLQRELDEALSDKQIDPGARGVLADVLATAAEGVLR